VTHKRFFFSEHWNFLHLLGKNKNKKKSTELQGQFFGFCVFCATFGQIWILQDLASTSGKKLKIIYQKLP
jgi:hypothetical protein